PDSSRTATLAPPRADPGPAHEAPPVAGPDASPGLAGQALAAVSWLAGAALVVLVARLLRGPSEALYLALTARTADLPGSGLVAEGGVLVLLGLCAAVAWRSRRGGPAAVATTLAAGAGAVVAYAASEAVKSPGPPPPRCLAHLSVARCPAPDHTAFPGH